MIYPIFLGELRWVFVFSARPCVWTNCWVSGPDGFSVVTPTSDGSTPHFLIKNMGKKGNHQKKHGNFQCFTMFSSFFSIKNAFPFFEETHLYTFVTIDSRSCDKHTVDGRNLHRWNPINSGMFTTYPLVICSIAIEHGPVEIVSFPIKNCESFHINHNFPMVFPLKNGFP